MDYIPRQESLLVTWLQNFKAKIVLHATELGLETAEVTPVITFCDSVITAVKDAGIAKSTYESVVKNKNSVVDGGVSTVRTFVGKIKNAQGFTETIGEDLGILKSISSTDFSVYKPTLKGVAHPGYVLIKFSKKGVDGINLYTRKKGDSEWKKLNLYMFSPCVDARPLAVAGQAENREYMGIGVIKDHETGMQSDIISVAFAG
jgi:hypothetical protein